MKQLTIAIPAFNAENNLADCLDSMCGVDDRLEVIVVNDGSTDSTGEIAHKYEARYPSQVRVIDKENGGHGSGVNAGLAAASGRYYKVIDSDDKITTDNLVFILDKLERSEADAVIMGYKTVNVSNGVVLEYLPVCSCNDRQIDMIKLNEKYDEISSCLEFHCLCYNTEFLRGTGILLSEHTFYEDQEFVILPFIYAETVLIIPDAMYEYRIGDAHQSISFENQAKRVRNHQAVVEGIVDYYAAHKPMGKARDEFLTRRIGRAVVSNYATLLVKNPDKKDGRQKATEFRKLLLAKEPNLVKLTDKKYRLFRKASHLKQTAGLYGRLFNSRAYRVFKDRWTK